MKSLLLINKTAAIQTVSYVDTVNEENAYSMVIRPGEKIVVTNDDTNDPLYEQLHLPTNDADFDIAKLKYDKNSMIIMVSDEADVIKGVVKDNDTNGYIQNATVTLTENVSVNPQSYITTTDQYGKFFFFDIPTGTYKLTIHKDGYNDEEITSISIPASGLLYYEVFLTKL